jgi:type VI secretion system protein ImpG
MDDDLLHYYERELTYIRELGGEFAGMYPKIAGRGVERTSRGPPRGEIIEAFAFLLRPASTRRSVDTLPEITESC